MLHGCMTNRRRLVAPEEIGKVLGYCFSQLCMREFFQLDYDAMNDKMKSRCEDGVLYLVGMQLSYLCGYISPQHGIADDPSRPGSPPSVIYMLT
jgi:hypothetical protein